jgi:HJR/Mrr/RecB family endonuclease
MNAVGNILGKIGIHISPRKRFEELSAPQFILLLVHLFNAMDYSVRQVGKTSDQGGDIVIDTGQDLIAVQLKCNRNTPVEVNDIQEAIIAQKYYGCFKTMIITVLNISKEVADLAKVNNIEFIDKRHLKEWTSKYLKERWS